MKFSEEEKAMWLEDWRKSGKGAWTYAKENGLIPQTFVGWTKAKTGNEPCFVEVVTKAISVEHREEILIEKGDGSLQSSCGHFREDKYLSLLPKI